MLTEITDYAARARARLLEQYKSRPKFSALVAAFAGRVQDLEVALFDLIDQTSVGTAVGVWLERLGAIVGEPKDGALEALYRRYVRARIRANRSLGTYEDVIAVVTEWYGATFPDLQLTELGRASFHVDLNDPDVDNTHALRLVRLLSSTRAAGIGCQMLWQLDGSSKVFTFATSSSLEADALAGFGDTANPATGGGLRSVAIV